MSIVALDFETNSLEWYYPTFHVTHLSVAYSSGRCVVLDNEVEIINALHAIAYDTTIDKVLVYNLGFDGSVVRYWYTELFALLEPKLIDVMRLRQHMEPDEAESWGLKAAAKKFLKVDAWEAEVQQQVAERGGVASKFREHLHLCDPLVVAKYNAMDSVYTLKLFNYFCSFFSNQGYDWKKDHEEYKRLVWRVTGAQKRGIRVDAENLAIYSSKIETELNEHITGFKELHKDAIDRLQLKWTEEERNKRKTEKGKAGVKPVVFNVGSNKQLAALFCGELGIEPRFRTPTGEPSFKSAHLFSYGAMAEALTTLGKRELVKNFCDKTVELSSVDGLLHHTMKIVGTVSGRLSGGGGLNMLAAPRRDAGYMSCLQAPEGQVFLSQDLCYPEYTEFLTPGGWKRFDEIQDNTLVCQVDPVSLNHSFTLPLRRVEGVYEDWITYTTARGALEVTKGHKMLWVGQVNHPTRKDKALYRKITKAGDWDDVTSGCHLPLFSNSDSVSNYTVEEIWKACMFHADGCCIRPNIYSIEVSKQRKIEKIEALVGKKGIPHTPRGLQILTPHSWNYIRFESPLLKGKAFDLSSLGANQADVFAEALSFWDGSMSTNSNSTNRFLWSTTKKEEADKVQAFLVTHGYEAHMRVATDRTTSLGTCDLYVLSVRKQGVIRVKKQESVIRIGAHERKAHSTTILDTRTIKKGVCFEVPKGFLLVRQHGDVFVSGNCSGEPTILAEFSKDKTYSYLTVGSRGKAPFWENKQLMLDDLYLSLLSTFPMGKAVMQDAWGKEWPAGTFVDQWLADPEVIKTSVKKLRQLAKICCLGLGYGMGAAKLKQTLFDNGFDVTDNECSAIHRAYWKAFPGVKDFATKQATRVTENQGFLVNPFGYAMHCSPHKALNYTIQSSLNYVINYYIERFLEELPSAEFVVTIHDELIVTITQDAVEEAKEAQKRAISALNNHLHVQHGWSLNVSLGFAVGADLYEAK